MNLYDEHYSAYFGAPGEEYPVGSGVDSTSEDRLDGTPFLAAFFNDVVGFFQAAFFGVFGNPFTPNAVVTRSPSNTPENAKRSDVWDAIKKFVTDRVSEIRDMIGAANGIAPLDESGQVPSNYLPSYVDDVLEFPTYADFPPVGESGKIYVAKDTNKEYRWGGSIYAELSKYELATQTSSGLMSAADKKKLDEIEKAAFDAAWPLYITYPQYPGQKSPQELWPNNGSQWKILTQYEGAFFRAEGGNALPFAPFGNAPVRQAASVNMAGITGTTSQKSLSATFKLSNAWATAYAEFLINQNSLPSSEDAAKSSGIGFWSNEVVDDAQAVKNAVGAVNYNGVTLRRVRMTAPVSGEVSGSSITVPQLSVSFSGSGNETRVDNYTFRIWQRIA